MPTAPEQNALARETSPYLLQHAANPVDWHPWSPATLAKAKAEDKPILLSVGYSACHWCHVMAHESFEDEETARLMNRLYVNIKVDREERPDLDKIYQLSHQLLTRRPGGWPLTMFLTPDDQTPFFGGTYFPLEPRFGMPSFKEILVRVEEFYRANRRDIATQNASLVRALASLEPRLGTPAPITSRPLEEARRELGGLFDSRHGGFGGAPKFPHCTNLELLLRRYARSAIDGRADETALEMVRLTLAKMASGGIYDHVGGGFCRYSVDPYWMIPHFEKMLYDNAPLLELCCALWQITGNERFARVARETADWVIREMQSPRGGYYSTLDADSEGEEGKYYVWEPQEVRALLTEDEYRVVATRFGLDQSPNFENRHWHLHTFVDDAALSERTGVDRAAIERLWDSARAKLFEHRSHRVRPGLDDKTLTAWNGLMIKGMATAGRVLAEPRFTDSAALALDYIRCHAWKDGRLLASSKDGEAHLAAYLDDYAFMIDGTLALLEARWRDSDLDFAGALAGVLLEHFEDPEEGGFYFTADDHEVLLHRSKPMMDDAVPAGNGVAARALGRLGHLLGETRFLEAAEKAIRLAWSGLERAPHAFNAILLAAEEYLDPPQSIVLRGSGDALAGWHERCGAHFSPRRQAFAIPAESSPSGLLAERTPRGDVVAYVCEGHQCGPPVTDLDELDALLAKSEVRRAAPV